MVVWPDGRPASGAEITLKDPASGRDAKWGVRTDANGHFAVAAFDSVPYTIAATIPANPNWDPNSGRSVQLLASSEVAVTPSANAAPVRLIINVQDDGVTRSKTILGVKPKKPL